mgnify:FL=1
MQKKEMNDLDNTIKWFKAIKRNNDMACILPNLPMMKNIIKWLEKLKEREGRRGDEWISASERLPESTLPVLCRVKSTTISCTETYIIGSYRKGCWFFQNDTVGTHSFPLSEYKVLTWMHLPEPYEED